VLRVRELEVRHPEFGELLPLILLLPVSRAFTFTRMQNKPPEA
jgi:hypothetical protein